MRVKTRQINGLEKCNIKTNQANTTKTFEDILNIGAALTAAHFPVNV